MEWFKTAYRSLFTSLRAKVIFTMITVLLFMTGLTSYVWFYYWREQLIELTEDQISLLFQSVEFSIERAMREGRQEEVGDILKRIHQKQELLSLRIYNTRGVIKRSSHVEEEGTRATDLGRHEAMDLVGLRLTSLRSGEGGELRLMYPIRKAKECETCHLSDEDYIGVLEMNLSLENVQDIINRNRNRMIYYSILTVLVLSLSIAFLFEREVHTPISKIVKTINEIESGNLTARINLSSKDELGLVAGNLNSMIGKLEDAIGEIREYHKKELKKSQRLAAIGELAASISHEIRNPLAGIKGAIQVILKDENITERHSIVLEEVLAQVDRLNGTVGDLLIFSRPLVPEISRTDVRSVLERTLDPLKLEPFLGDVEIVREFEDVRQIRVDPNLMEQAFFNLVINSLQAMGGVGTLVAKVEESEENVLVIFKDNGCGITVENLGKIFRPFYTTKHRGTGLGLSIARNIIEAHNGIIEVTSEEGRGTTFTINLPKDPPQVS
jgi:signal transduction histidine kinase